MAWRWALALLGARRAPVAEPRQVLQGHQLAHRRLHAHAYAHAHASICTHACTPRWPWHPPALSSLHGCMSTDGCTDAGACRHAGTWMQRAAWAQPHRTHDGVRLRAQRTCLRCRLQLPSQQTDAASCSATNSVSRRTERSGAAVRPCMGHPGNHAAMTHPRQAGRRARAAAVTQGC